MKNSCFTRFYFNEKFKTLPRYLLITLLLALSVATQGVGAKQQHEQEKKISLSLKQTSLISLFRAIERESDYLFNYKDNDVLGLKTSVEIKDGRVNDLMDHALRQTNLTYSIDGRHITIIKKSASLSADTEKRIITGVVEDQSGMPLVGVSISIKGETVGTISDANGTFSLEIAPGATIVISHLGYEREELKPSGKKSYYQITLKELFQELEELVVVGYGTQKKVNLTGAISVLSGKDLAGKTAGQTSAALQGMLPGVTVTQRSGQPGEDGGTIRIRGIGTISNSSPLILVDGIEGSLNNVDPSTIESISVLKDAASASIYGSRAANGVVLVQTKRGNSGKFNITYKNYLGWQNPTDMPRLVDALGYMELLNLAYSNVGREPLYSKELIHEYTQQNGVSSDQYPNTNWRKETVKEAAFQQNHVVNISGGSENLKTFTSIGYFFQDGLIENNKFNRVFIRNNMDWTISNQLSVRLDLQFVKNYVNISSTNPRTIFQWLNGIPSNQVGINSNGSWGVGWNGANPISHAKDAGVNIGHYPVGVVSGTIIYKPVEWITAEVNASPKYGVTHEHHVRKPIQTFLPDGTPSYLNPVKSELREVSNYSVNNHFRATVTADKQLTENHRLKALVGFSQEEFKWKGFEAYRDSIDVNFPVLNTGGAANRGNGGSAYEWALRSFFGRLNYDYKQRYLVELNLRYDGSSRFVEKNKYAWFPSVSAGWRVSNEPFMEGLIPFLDDAKIRASWGQLGNQNIGNYPFSSQIIYGIGSMDGAVTNTAALNQMPNPLIKWETTESFDLGVDLVFLSNKLSITADYYTRFTKDILLKLDVPLITGLEAPYQNAGSVENRGWEVAIGYRDHVGELSYDINFNISDVRNKIIDLKGQDATTLVANRTDHPLNALFGYVAEGYFQNEEEITNHATQFGAVMPGDIKYKDLNGDNVIDINDKQIIGSTIPRYTFGLHVGASYKGFNLSLFFQGVGKADGYLYGAGVWPFETTGAVGGTIREDNRDFWTPENREAKYPRLAFGEINNQQHSSFWVQDASYLRLKNLEVGYRIPQRVLHKSGIEKLRLFVNGTNLLSFDRFLKGYNVESPVSDGFYYPLVKLYSFGIELSF